MKKHLVAVPVVIALLTFGVSGKSMALDVVVPVAVDNSTAVGVNDTLNDNTLLNDTVEGNAAANDQSIATSDSLNGNNVAAADSIAVKDSLNNNTLSDIANDKSTDQKAKAEEGSAATNNGNALAVNLKADADGKSNAASVIGDATSSNNGDAEAFGAHNAVANNGSTVNLDDSINISDIRVAVATSILDGEVSHNEISFGNGTEMKAYGNDGGSAVNLSSQKNKATGLNGALQANGTDQDNGALQGNGALQANAALQGGQAATADNNRDDVDAEANGSDNALGENKSGQANLALGANKAKSENEAFGANLASEANTADQAADATTGDYSVAQTASYSLATGANNLAGSITASGINSIAMNTGINALFQQSVNVQATVNNPGTVQ